MPVITTTEHIILDSSGQPAEGRILFTQSARGIVDGDLVTTTPGTVTVKGGRIVMPKLFTLPETGDGEGVLVVEMFRNRGEATRNVTYWVEVPDVASIEYADLPQITSPTAGPGIPPWAAELLDALEDVGNMNDPIVSGLVDDEGSDTRETLDALYADVVNVRVFGATGDGVTDDTAAINAAQAAAVNKPLYFPRGTYRFSDTLRAQTILGANRQTTILRYTGSVAAVGAPNPVVTRTYDRRIENLTLWGNGGAGAGIGIDVDAASAGYYNNLLVRSFWRGVVLHSSIPLPAQSLYNVFIDVTTSDIDGYAFVLQDISNENRFIACRTNGCTRGFQIESGNRNVITGCAIEGASERGVSIHDSVPGSNVTRGTVISDNRFEGVPNAVTIFAGVMNTVVAHNRFISPATYIDNGTGTFLIHQESGAVAPGRYTTANRPTVVAVGSMIWDITLGKPIWWNGSVWKDAAGTTV